MWSFPTLRSEALYDGSPFRLLQKFTMLVSGSGFIPEGLGEGCLHA
jgi:hypothetical protein